MKTRFDSPRIGIMVIVLAVGLAVLWAVSAYGTYEESEREKFDNRVKPGAVTYGTHSSATVPVVSVPMRHSGIPMVSGGAVRAYAHYGHASMPSASSGSGFRLHTTSSATIHTLGSGGGGGVGSAGGSSSSSRGVSHSGGSVAMPSFAIALPTSASSAQVEENSLLAATPSRSGHVRKANSHAGETGTGGDKYPDTENPSIWWYWDEGEEDWVSGDPPVGTVKEEGGYYWEWDGSSWVRKGEVSDLGAPVGDAPWWLMTLMLAVYGIVRTIKRKRTLSEK